VSSLQLAKEYNGSWQLAVGKGTKWQWAVGNSSGQLARAVGNFIEIYLKGE
jgi:hypothetical protein